MRNTDQDWQQIAEQAPYYGVLAHEKFRNPTEETLAEFFATGERDIELLLATIRTHFGDFNPKSGLDFGCGPGRQLIPIARETGDACGVDISDRMLELASHHIAAAGVNATVGTDLPDRLFDWVNSSIVMQHIPPRRGYELLPRLWEAVSPGGVMSIHLTIYHEGFDAELMEDLGRYRYDGEEVVSYVDATATAGAMSMYDYDLSRAFAVCGFPDGQPLYLLNTVHGSSHGVLLFARKAMESARSEVEQGQIEIKQSPESCDHLSYQNFQQKNLEISSNGIDNPTVVRVLYNTLLNRDPDPEGFKHHVSLLDQRKITQHQAAMSFVASTEFSDIYKKFPDIQIDKVWEQIKLDDCRVYAGYKSEDLAVFMAFSNANPQPRPGFLTEFVGSRARISSLWDGCHELDGKVLPLPVPGDYHADAVEWLGVLKAVLAAKETFTAMEWGAGHGPWIAAGAAAARVRGIKTLSLCAVEGDPGRFELLEQNIKDNSLEGHDVTLIQAAVGITDGTARWPRVSDPRNVSGARPIREGNSDDEVYGRELADETIEVQIISATRLLAFRPLWDLVHIDIQGTEAEVCAACLDTLSERVRYLVIGTHSRKIDGDLMETFLKDGWVLEHEKPTRMNCAPASSLILLTTGDGTQVWRNPRL